MHESRLAHHKRQEYYFSFLFGHDIPTFSAFALRIEGFESDSTTRFELMLIVLTRIIPVRASRPTCRYGDHFSVKSLAFVSG